MIVRCDQCSTRFRLDDSHVPAAGIRVRCSRCKHAFFLQPPGSHESEALHQAAIEAAAAATPPPPGTTQDLPSEAEIDGTGADALDFEEVEESDWQFNEELPEPDDEPDTPLAALPEVSAAADAMPEEIGASSGAFGSVEDLSNLSWAPSEVGGEVQAPEHEPEIRTESEEPVSGIPEEDPAADELGDPESWNLVGERVLEHPSSPPLESVAASPVESSQSESLSSAATGPDLDTPPLKALERTRTPSWLGRAGRAAGWIGVMGLFGLGVLRGAGGHFEPAASAAPTVELGSFSASEVHAYWLDTARAGTLYVVEGRLRNLQPVDLAPGAGLRVRLESLSRAESGDVVAPLAVPLREPLMRELAPNDLWDSLGRAAQEFASARIAPGESIQFAAVFAALPDAATGFTLEASGPPPAAGP